MPEPPPGAPIRRRGRHRRRGLWVFLTLLTVVLGIAAGTGIWALVRPVPPPDPFGLRRLLFRKRINTMQPAYFQFF